MRKNDLNTLIRFTGVITRRTQVFQQLKVVFYICPCGDRKGPFYITDDMSHNLGSCAVCQSKSNFAMDTEKTIYRNHQKITVQETPGSIPPGRVPRHREVILLGDNIDVARPGDEVEITGIYTNRLDYELNIKHGFPIFQTSIEANYIKRVPIFKCNRLVNYFLNKNKQIDD